MLKIKAEKGKASVMHEKICPQCRAAALKKWEELSDEEKMLAERLPASAHLSLEQRRRNYFCPRCWYEQTGNFNEYA